MTSIVERRARDPGEVLFLCDCSPPRSADGAALQAAAQVGADFVCVAYNPGKATRASSVLAAAWLREHGQATVFNLATRDMNPLALQSLLVGAALLGLENVLVLEGDRFSEREQQSVRAVEGLSPTALLASIRGLGEGVDFRGRKLEAPVTLCAGATIDLGREPEREVALTARKLDAGAQYFLVQPPWDSERVERFLDQYARSQGGPLEPPLFVGLQVMTADSIRFGEIPADVIEDLDRGRPGEEIALDSLRGLVGRGFPSIYLVPPILPGGARDYAAARAVVDAARR